MLQSAFVAEENWELFRNSIPVRYISLGRQAQLAPFARLACSSFFEEGQLRFEGHPRVQAQIYR